MSRELMVRIGVLYAPVLFALLAGALRGNRTRMLAACLLSLLWTVPALVVLQRLNAFYGWWSYLAGNLSLRGMPLEVWFGWSVLWGTVPQLLLHDVKLRWSVVVMVGLDLLAMPLCAPVVHLGPRWLVGETVAVLLVLLPALFVSRWTLECSHLHWRAGMQVATAALVFLYLAPEVVFALRPGAGWNQLLSLRGWRVDMAFLMLFTLMLSGLTAVQEFVERGGGTPLPYDPPHRLVTSGVYRYCANPMQLGCTLTMFGWAFVLHSAWLLVPAVISGVYSAGIAEWDERQDLEERFGKAFAAYRKEVPRWRFRVLPYEDGAASKLYPARTCSSCSQLRRWIEARQPQGLELLDAESMCIAGGMGAMRRLRYVAPDGTETEGVRALGRALEHLHLGWAIVGGIMRLPLIWVALQALTDASGFGPRELTPDISAPNEVR